MGVKKHIFTSFFSSKDKCLPCVDTFVSDCIHSFIIASGSVEMSVCPVQIGAAAHVAYYLTNNNIVGLGHLKNGACMCILTAHSLFRYFCLVFSLNDKIVTVSFNCYLPLSLFGKYVYYCFILFFISLCIALIPTNQQQASIVHNSLIAFKKVFVFISKKREKKIDS